MGCRNQHGIRESRPIEKWFHSPRKVAAMSSAMRFNPSRNFSLAMARRAVPTHKPLDRLNYTVEEIDSHHPGDRMCG
jgi:hypothetical protein